MTSGGQTNIKSSSRVSVTPCGSAARTASRTRRPARWKPWARATMLDERSLRHRSLGPQDRLDQRGKARTVVLVIETLRIEVG